MLHFTTIRLAIQYVEVAYVKLSKHGPIINTFLLIFKFPEKI